MEPGEKSVELLELSETEKLNEALHELRKEKRNAKAATTRGSGHLASLLSVSEPEISRIREALQRLEEQRQETLKVMDALEDVYRKLREFDNAKKVGDEADSVTEQVEIVAEPARKYLATRIETLKQDIVYSPTQSSSPFENQDFEKSQQKYEQKHLWEDNNDMTPIEGNLSHRQLERIKIPIFRGEKLEFQRWFAAFSTCVDQTTLQPQFKMLRLEACLEGEAAETVKGLGYSAIAYETAKARLIRKFGGERRQVQSHLEGLKKMKPLQEDNVQELEKFADVLERAVVNLKENGRKADLEAGTLYSIVLEKIPQKLLSQYYRKLHDSGENESLETLKNWIAEEADFQVKASEIKHGLSGGQKREAKYKSLPYSGKGNDKQPRSFTTNFDGGDKRNRACRVCSEIHPIWKCEVFKSRQLEQKWKIAKQLGLCYRCLGDDHLGSACKWNRECRIDGCRESHHRLLHGQKTRNTNQRQGKQSPLSNNQTTQTRTGGSSNQVSGQGGVNPTIDQPQRGVSGLSMEGEANTGLATLETVTEHEMESVALRTVPIILKNGVNRLLVNCLMDEGSDTTYVNEDVVEQLGLKGRRERVTVNVANNQQVTFMSTTFQIAIESIDGTVDTTIVAKTSQKICGGLKPVKWIESKKNWKHLEDIPFPKVAARGIIDVLLGADHYHLMYPKQEVIGKPDEPYARLCPLGWTAVGRIGAKASQKQGETRFLHSFRIQQLSEGEVLDDRSDDVNTTLKRFWDLETMGIMPTGPGMTPEEKLAWTKVSSSLTFDGERYEVSVPWREDRPSLPNNHRLAEQRLESTERKLLKHKEIAKAYQEVIIDYVNKGYVRRVPADEPKPESQWLLAHFPVVRPEKATTKVRIVFDASAEVDGKSVNTESLPGPKLQTEVFDILLRFRKDLVALVGDISQMYHQVSLKTEDRPFHRFLWRDLDRNRQPDIYEFTRVVFGGCYGPFCAQYAWQNHAHQNENEFPLAAEAVKKNCYMDDLMPSVATVKDATEMRRQLTELGDRASFHIRKWISNQPEVIADIPEGDRASQIDLEKNEFPTTKTLGVLWTACDDTFSFHYSPPPEDFDITKRNVLKKMATIFDPLGFIIPYVMRAKLLMQQAWIEALSWDDQLPDHLREDWKLWFREMSELEQIRIPRCLKSEKIERATIHTFTDASEKAYAAVVYVRNEHIGGDVSTRLIAAKSRLAPLKAMSIPRLELMGALIGLRLTKQVCMALEMPLSGATYWIDSLNVGFWIRGQSRNYKPFVSHRVGEIHEHSNPDQWRYVPTTKNPADKATRGLTVSELAKDTCWWEGPEFLMKAEEYWPERKFGSSAEAHEEIKVERRDRFEKPVIPVLNSYFVGEQLQRNEETMNKDQGTWKLDPTRYSKWYRVHPRIGKEIGNSLVRVRSWVQRFIDNARNPKAQRTFGELTPGELQNTENRIIREAQIDIFSEEINALEHGKPLPRRSSLLAFTPVMIDRLLRSNTRLRNSEELSVNTKFPIILPKNHAVTGLIVKYYHEIEGHEMGINFTINHLREKYLVCHCRQEVKKCVRNCAECRRRFRGTPAHQQMAPLPKIRLEKTMRPFTNCCTDFGGPYLTIQGRGKTRAKRYLCLFLCLQTHCCHLEMAASLETDAFLRAFTRMVARRGWPQKMLSDNGTNFVGANKELMELVKQIDPEVIERLTANHGVSWYWNPPAGPHFGGVFESMIKSAKRAISAVLLNADVNDEELQTVFTGVESLLNSRPLTTLSGDPNDEPVLTPNHFLIGHMGGELAPNSVDTTKFNPRNRWRRVQELIRHVWQRWMREYLPEIGSRQKWFFPSRNLQKGDVVLVIDPDAPRRKWHVGRIQATYPGRDGLVRVADVWSEGKVTRRPIHRLSPLEAESYEHEDADQATS